MSKKIRRWHFWKCFQGIYNGTHAFAEILGLEKRGFKAKVWTPLPQHKTSGHIHIVVLCTFDELIKLAGINE